VQKLNGSPGIEDGKLNCR